MFRFKRKKENEFLRKKPKKNNRKLLYDITNLVVPIFIVLIGIFISAQKFAEYVEYNPRWCDAPIYLLKHRIFAFPKGYPIFNPFIIMLTMFTNPFDDFLQDAISNSVMPSMILACVAVVVWLVIAIIRTAGINKDKNIYGTARWGNENDLAQFGLCKSRGVILAQQWSAVSEMTVNSAGNFGLKIFKTAPFVCHEGTSHTLMIAPTRSGKGVGSIVPTCVSYPESMIIFDPKGELYNMTAGYRKKFSHVIKFSPVQMETACFNPLEEVVLDQNAFRDIGTILQNVFQKSEKGGDSNSDFFDNNARDLLTGVIFHVLSAVKDDGTPLYPPESKTIAGCLSILATAANGKDENGEPLPAGEELLDEMIASTHLDKDGKVSEYIHNIVLEVAGSAKQQHEKVRSDIMQTIQSKLNLFRDPFIKHVTSHSDFKLQDFYDCKRPITLYLTLPFGDIDRIMPIFQLIIDFILRRFSSGEIRAGEKEKKLKHPILFLLDEFPTLGKMKFLSTSMGVLAGYGMRFFIVVQMYSQLLDIYGQNNTFIANCRYIIIYKPSQPSDQEMFSKMIGKESVSNENVSISGSRFQVALNNLNASSQEVQRELINPDELGKLPYTDAIIFGEGMPPYMAKKVAFYDDPRLSWKVFFENVDTGEVKSGFPAPYEQKEIEAECSQLPSQILKRKLAAEAASGEARSVVVREKVDFDPVAFLTSYSSRGMEDGIDEDFLPDDFFDSPFDVPPESDERSEPPPTVAVHRVEDFANAEV